MGKKCFCRRHFDNFTRIHQCNAISDPRQQRKVMSDENKRQTAFVLQVIEELENLTRYSDIQSRGRLIRHHHFGICRECHGDHRALLQTARQLMRISVISFFRARNADSAQPLDGTRSCLRASARRMRADHFRHLIAHRHHGVKARCRFLKDHGNACPADALHFLLSEGQELSSLERHRPRRHLSILGQQPHQRHRSKAFAAARFPHKRQRFTAAYGETHAAHRVKHAARERQIYRQAVDR